MDANFYRNYKRKFFIGLGVLLALTCLALAKYNTILGIFGLFTVVIGLYAFSYMDKQEQSVRERELREEILSTERSRYLKSGLPRPLMSLLWYLCRLMIMTRFFMGWQMKSALCWWPQWINFCGNGREK